jgi:hypothetical protein
VTRRSPFTAAEIARARFIERRLYKLGYSVAACARKSGRYASVVSNDLRAAGIEIRGNVGRRRRARPGRRLREIRASVFTILRRKRMPDQGIGSVGSSPATSASSGG